MLWQFCSGTSNSSSKTRGAAAPRTRITWEVFLRFRRTFAEVITFISRNINYNINSLLRLRVGTHIIYIYISSVTYRKSK